MASEKDVAQLDLHWFRLLSDADLMKVCKMQYRFVRMFIADEPKSTFTDGQSLYNHLEDMWASKWAETNSLPHIGQKPVQVVLAWFLSLAAHMLSATGLVSIGSPPSAAKTIMTQSSQSAKRPLIEDVVGQGEAFPSRRAKRSRPTASTSIDVIDLTMSDDECATREPPGFTLNPRQPSYTGSSIKQKPALPASVESASSLNNNEPILQATDDDEGDGDDPDAPIPGAVLSKSVEEAFAAAKKLKYKPFLHVPTMAGRSTGGYEEHWLQYYYNRKNDYTRDSTDWRRRRDNLTYYAPTKTFSATGFTAYLQASGLSGLHARRLLTWLQNNSRFTHVASNGVRFDKVNRGVAQTFARRCGFFDTMKPFFDFCAKQVQVQDFCCYRCGEEELLPNDANNHHRAHWNDHDPIDTAKDRTRRCPNPGCNVIYSVEWKKDIDDHEKTCEHRVDWM